MTPRIPSPEDEAFDVFLEDIEVLDYMTGLALTDAHEGDIEAVKRKLHILRFLIRHHVIALLGIKDGEDR